MLSWLQRIRIRAVRVLGVEIELEDRRGHSGSDCPQVQPHFTSIGERAEIPFVFMSGSKVLADTAAAELGRFRDVCQAIGEVIGQLGLGIVGCPPHPSRVLASQEARTGALRANPEARFCDGRVEFPLNDSDRERFAQLASGAIFVGGGRGTLDEYRFCLDADVVPLIPVAGCRGSGAELARKMWNLTGEMVTKKARGAGYALPVLANEDAAPQEYAGAIRAILAAGELKKKPKSLFDRLLAGRRDVRSGDGDWLPEGFRHRRGLRIGNEWHGPYGEMLWFDGERVHHVPPSND